MSQAQRNRVIKKLVPGLKSSNVERTQKKKIVSQKQKELERQLVNEIVHADFVRKQLAVPGGIVEEDEIIEVPQQNIKKRVYLRDPNEAERLRQSITGLNPINDFSLATLQEIEKNSLKARDRAIELALRGRKTKLLEKWKTTLTQNEGDVRDFLDYTYNSAVTLNSYIQSFGWTLGTLQSQYVAKGPENQLTGNLLALRNKYISKSSVEYFAVEWSILTGWNRWVATFQSKNFKIPNVDRQTIAAKGRFTSARRLANRLKTDAVYANKLSTKDLIREEKAKTRQQNLDLYRKAIAER